MGVEVRLARETNKKIYNIYIYIYIYIICIYV